MRNKFKILEVNGTSLRCDNTQCDYVSEDKYDDLISHIHDECPKCGQNLLTYEDYKGHVRYMKIIKFINMICWPYMLLRGGKKPEECVETELNYHNGEYKIKENNNEMEK